MPIHYPLNIAVQLSPRVPTHEINSIIVIRSLRKLVRQNSVAIHKDGIVFLFNLPNNSYGHMSHMLIYEKE